MATYIEEKLIKCSQCNKKTIHMRNNNKTSGFMLLIHLLLAIVTVGAWLILVIIWKIFNSPIGGWQCKECQPK